MALTKINGLIFRRVLNISARHCSSENKLIPDVKDLARVNLNTEVVVSSTHLKKNQNSVLTELKNKDSILFNPAVPQKSASLATFVSKSELLQNFVKLGIDLSKVEEDRDIASYLVKADFKTDIQPYILFLYDQGIAPVDMGHIFTKNPSIFKESLDKLQLRIDYFKSKNFPQQSIAKIVTKQPCLLTTSTLITDKQLGFLEREFKLSADEVRHVATKYPKLIVWRQNLIQENKLHLISVMGFNSKEVKSILLSDPKILAAGKFAIAERFDYIHNFIGLSHKKILTWPIVLRTRLVIIKPRHEFLKSIGRDQYDNKVENYVSLQALVTGTDSEFCTNVAKVSVEKYNEYLKTQ